MEDEAWQHITVSSALHDDEEEEEESSIRENYIHISAFPPNHHECLQPLLPHNHSSSSSPLVELDDDDDDDDDEPGSSIKRATSARLYGRCVCFGIRYWKFASVVAAAAVALMYIKKKQWLWWWWPQKKEDKASRLTRLIKERDQRINQLLLQIAQMNQLLLTRRTVPVVRVDYT